MKAKPPDLKTITHLPVNKFNEFFTTVSVKKYTNTCFIIDGWCVLWLAHDAGMPVKLAFNSIACHVTFFRPIQE
jgi:hypothetical protein